MAKPQVPDFANLAAQQAAINKTGALDVAQQNRYTQQGAGGETNQWITDPTTGAVTNKTSMGPQQQAMYEALMQGGQGALGSFQKQYWGGGAGGGGAGDGAGGGGGGGGVNINIPGGAGGGMIPGNIQTDLDLSGLSAMPGSDVGAARQQAQDALYARHAGYLDPQYAEQERSQRTMLANQGLTPGTPAYDRAYANAAREKESAYTGARQDAIVGGGLEAERAQKMALELRNQGLSEEQIKGVFHNAAQGQGADQWLTKYGHDTGLQGTLGAAGISANASMASNAATNALNTRKQQYLEALGMGEQAQAFLPQFGIDQGNVKPYAPEDAYGAKADQYAAELARAKAKKPGLLSQLLPIAGSIGGSFASGYGGALGKVLGGR